jgi:hypothetical protein
MSAKTRTVQTPEQKEVYWLRRITQRANSVFPAFVKELNEIMDMANHALSDENKRKLRILIANDLGKPLTRLNIKDELPPQPPKLPKKGVHTTGSDKHPTASNDQGVDQGNGQEPTSTAGDVPHKVTEQHLPSSVPAEQGGEVPVSQSSDTPQPDSK